MNFKQPKQQRFKYLKNKLIKITVGAVNIFVIFHLLKRNGPKNIALFSTLYFKQCKKLSTDGTVHLMFVQGQKNLCDPPNSI